MVVTLGNKTNENFKFKVNMKCAVTLVSPTSPLVPELIYPISGVFHKEEIIQLTFTFSPAECVASHDFSIAEMPETDFVRKGADLIKINTDKIVDIGSFTVTLTVDASPRNYIVLNPPTVSFNLKVLKPCAV